VAVGAVVVVALLMRAVRRPDEDAITRAPQSPHEPWREAGNMSVADDEEADGDGDDDREDGGHVIAVTSDGYAFVPDRHAVRLVPPEEHGEEWKVGAGIRSASQRGQQALAMSWQSSEFTGIRIVHGEADEGPWRMEALGRDGEYTAFVFETREGADAAQKLFEQHGIVHLGEDEDGQPMPPSAEQFAEARRIYLETEAALELPDDEGPR